VGRCDPLIADARWHVFAHRARYVSVALIGCAGLAPLTATAADEAAPITTIEVIGTTPLPGLGTRLDQVPSNVQTFGARDLARQRTGGVAEFLNLNANSIALNSPTGNSLQPDLSFRGFTASSLLGTPQGLSVFQDGVRINEAFADVVNWDLLPRDLTIARWVHLAGAVAFIVAIVGGGWYARSRARP